MLTTKKLIATSLLAGGLAATSGVAEAGFSANVAMTTDYVWRGVSQTNEDPAIQGGFDYEHESGFSFGTWGSNVDFGSVENMELDLYGAYSHSFGDLGASIGFIRYMYFDSGNDIDFTEINGSLSYKWLTFSIANDFDNDNLYYSLGASYDLPQGLSLAATVGKYEFDSGDDYVHYSIGVSKEIGGFGFDLTYHDTNSNGTDLFGKIADGRLVLTVSKSM